jgi:hypothetical protein
LVSVRSLREAAEIASLPIEILDLKEPRRGPLGAADAKIWQQCLREVPFAGRWSVALGEAQTALPVAERVPGGIAFAKAGPAGIPKAARLRQLWQQLRERLPESTELVAVAYADHHAARCPPVEDVLEAACRAGLKKLLIDTCAKTGRNSLDELGPQRLEHLVSRARQLEVAIALAGSLGCDEIDRIGRLKVSLMGVRGSVCSGGRDGYIDRNATIRLCQRLRSRAQWGTLGRLGRESTGPEF